MKTIIIAALAAALLVAPATTNAQETEGCTTVDYQGAPLEMCPPQEPDPTNCYMGDYQGAPIEICMPTGWEPDPSWTYQGEPIVMSDSTADDLQAAADAWRATHECWIDDDPSRPIPQGEFVTYDTRLEPGAIGSHSIGGTPCGYPIADIGTPPEPVSVRMSVAPMDMSWVADYVAILG